ncbi:unnamed protein product [Ambrosiozyma monospora]|uniref:Unnamed protein product n=1 Tax=Ambrosiozyma monospora TaxID=43982 RepID=A0ACB5TPY9_AMBMO|nr:unnamed protein product [Ambrosiozyma monospora]
MVRSLKEHLSWKQNVSTSSTKIKKALKEKEKEKPPIEANDVESETLNISRTFVRGRQPASKRRRTRGGAVMAAHSRILNKDDNNSAIGGVDDAMVELVERQLKEDVENEEEQDDDDEDEDYKDDMVSQSNDIDNFDSFLQQLEGSSGVSNFGLSYELIDRTQEVIIERFDSESGDMLLNELMPSYIIMYEPDLPFVRQVETYQSLRSNNSAKCYFMIYQNSIEEQMFLTAIKKEKDAFTRLIREKANLPKFFSTEEDDQAKFMSTFNDNYTTPATSNARTRIAGGSTTTEVAEQKTKVIVDSREFRSQLPFLCYLSGLEVIPCMLTVADYVLSPKICVERKAIPDLISSLKKGRLYQQCEQMFKYYETPVLLIEFEEGKSFSLEPFTTGFRNGIPNAIAGGAANTNSMMNDLQLKLMILLTSFPALRIIWTSSPFETAKVFRELKRSQDEPDVEEAINFGLNPSFNKDTTFNDAAIDLLRNIPGITDVNYMLILQKVSSLKELSAMTLEQLAPLVGTESATKITKFFNRRV